MRVRTIREHFNEYGESYFKSGSAGPVYDAPDEVARNLIASGYVEAADDEPPTAVKKKGRRKK